MTRALFKINDSITFQISGHCQYLGKVLFLLLYIWPGLNCSPRGCLHTSLFEAIRLQSSQFTHKNLLVHHHRISNVETYSTVLHSTYKIQNYNMLSLQWILENKVVYSNYSLLEKFHSKQTVCMCHTNIFIHRGCLTKNNKFLHSRTRISMLMCFKSLFTYTTVVIK